MALDSIYKNMNLFVDGRGHVGNVEEITPPKLTMVTEEFRGGGMDAPMDIDLGMEKLEMDFTLTSFDAETLKSYGNNVIPLSIRGAVQDELTGDVKPVVYTIQGRMREIDYGSWKSGEKAVTKFMVTLVFYKLEIDGQTIHEIDVRNGTRVIGGVDQTADIRAALGI